MMVEDVARKSLVTWWTGSTSVGGGRYNQVLPLRLSML